MANAIGNRISFKIDDAQLQAVMSALQFVMGALMPLLMNLSIDDRRALPKMGAKTLDFVTKTLAYARSNPQYQPSFVDLDEFAIDLAAVGVLRQIQQPLSQLLSMLDDSLLLSGSEALSASLVCYKAFRAAAEVNAPGAGVIAADLGARFPGRPAKSASKASRAKVSPPQADIAP